MFTSRQWLLGLSHGDLEEGWAEVAAAIGVEATHLSRARQVHGVGVLRAGMTSPVEADIIMTDDPARAVAIQAADCVPLLILDRATHAVAAVHAGWRGLSARAPQRAVSALDKTFRSRRSDLVAAIGPSIGACCYEVGRDVRDAFASAGFTSGNLSDWFADRPRESARNLSMDGLSSVRRPDHWFFDAWAAARFQLEEIGVAPDQIHIAELCTASHTTFCSYRRDGPPAGRMAAAIRRRTSVGP